MAMNQDRPLVTLVAARPPPSVPVRWVQVDPDLWVGTRLGEYAGIITSTARGYLVTDRFTQAVASFFHLDQAQQGLDQPDG